MNHLDRHDMNIFREIMTNTLKNTTLTNVELLKYMNYYYHQLKQTKQPKEYTSYDLVLLNEIRYFKEGVWACLKDIIHDLPSQLQIDTRMFNTLVLQAELYDCMTVNIDDAVTKRECVSLIKDLMITINEMENSCCDHIESISTYKEKGKQYFVLSLCVENDNLLIVGEQLEEVLQFAKKLFSKQPKSMNTKEAAASILDYSKQVKYPNLSIQELTKLYQKPILYAKDNIALNVWQ